MTITIHNLYREKLTNHDTDFIVDRRSPVGNPFYLKDETHRDEVCDQYETYARTNQNPAFTSFIDSLVVVAKAGDLRLFCWCAPLRCHAETIKTLIEEKINEQGSRET